MKLPSLDAALQLLLVVAPDGASGEFRLQRFTRQGGGLPWAAVGMPVPVSLGRAGLAWASEFVAAGAVPAPLKREGDGCSPAGVFPITALFGTGAPPAGAKLPWLPATADLKCVDDPASRHYNRIVDQGQVDRIDWSSAEDMLRDDGRYELGAVIGCNCDPVRAGAGSCIFLHVWASEGAPTAGCTAMALADMKRLAGWLDAARAPLLVQLPRDAYERLRGPWGLPDFPA